MTLSPVGHINTPASLASTETQVGSSPQPPREMQAMSFCMQKPTTDHRSERRPFARGLLLACLAICALFPASLHGATAADFLAGKVVKQGAEKYDLPYRYYVPPSYYDTATAYPLIVFLHGAGEKGNNNTSQLNNNANGALQLISGDNATAYPAFMLAPQANTSEGWNANTLTQVMRAIDQLGASYTIDRNRIYVTGLSMGGNGTWQIITLFPFSFAAAVPMSGWSSGNLDRVTLLPIWAFHAVDDPTVAVSGTDGATITVRKDGGHVIYTRYATGGHGIWPTAYATPSLLPWMMAQRRNQPVAGIPALTITSPSVEVLPPPGPTSMTITGTTALPDGITQVNWTTAPSGGGAGIDPSGYSLATGTTNWTVSTTTSSSIFYVVATGPTWGRNGVGGGANTVNDSFFRVPRGSDLTVPTIAITSPADSFIQTADAQIGLSGTAAPAGTKVLRAVTWRNDRGGEGKAVGTATWSVEKIDLAPGDNVISMTVRDNVSIVATTQIVVRRSEVNTNTPPTLTSIADQTVQSGQTLSNVVFTVGDIETPTTALTVTAVSSNTTLLPAGSLVLSGTDAQRSLSITPAAGQTGSAVITVEVSDGFLTSSRSFNLTVTAVPPPPATTLVVDVDFGLNTTQTTGNFTNVTNIQAGGAPVTAIAQDGTTTGIQISVTDSFVGINSAGVTAGGVFPASAQSDSFYVDTNNALGVVKLSNLDPTKKYTIALLASRQATDNRGTVFTINGVAQSINAAGNASQLVTFADLIPSNGAIQIEVRAGPGSSYGYLNALRLTASP